VTQKLPHNEYDFEIIYKAYPARVNGKVPSEVIAFVAQCIASKIGRTNEQYIPFFRYLWQKKGDSGKLAFTYIISKFISKKPDVYFPHIEWALQDADPASINMIIDRILLPLIKKHRDTYLPMLYTWIRHSNPEIARLSMHALIKLIKKEADLIPLVLEHFIHQWSYPLDSQSANHILLLKTVGKLDRSQYLAVYEEYKMTRDPQTVEILCGAVYDYDSLLLEAVENWTHSGNARVKKAATAALRILNKKKI
jgi:hypothetical protein